MVENSFSDTSASAKELNYFKSETLCLELLVYIFENFCFANGVYNKTVKHNLFLSKGHIAKLPFICGLHNIDFIKSN